MYCLIYFHFLIDLFFLMVLLNGLALDLEQTAGLHILDAATLRWRAKVRSQLSEVRCL